jgi:polar amino acid transport system permease protein
VIDHLGAFLGGLRVTVVVSGLAVAWGTAAALGLGSALAYGPWFVRAAVRWYVEVLRGVSAIILVFWIYYALPLVGPSIDATAAGVLALGLNLSAYGAELVRGALGGVHAGQAEAAAAIHLSTWQRLVYVDGPQSLALLLPPLGNLYIEITKASSLVSLISLTDLTRAGQNLRVERAASSLEIFSVVMVLYFGLSLAIGTVVGAAERRVRRQPLLQVR